MKGQVVIEMNQTAFLLSSWYSGATLLTLLLDFHPEIVSNGEAFPFDSKHQYPVCSCGKSLQECRFYRYAAGHMWNGQRYHPDLFLREPNLEFSGLVQRFSMSPRFSGPLRHTIMGFSKKYRRKIDEFSRAHMLFMDRAADFSGAAVYLDATKSLPRSEILLRRIQGRKHLWLLVRDCRGFCNSVLRVRQWPVGNIPLAVREWLNYIRFSKRLAKKYPEANFRILRYEDLCASPLTVLNELFSELGVSSRQSIYGDNHTPHLLGNKMRMAFDGKIELKEHWRTALDEKTKAEIMKLAHEQMAELGYV